jgi:capsular polysaccharide biosynthesis protein
MSKYLDGVKRVTLLLLIVSLVFMTINISFRTLEIPKTFETFTAIVITYYFTKKENKNE